MTELEQLRAERDTLLARIGRIQGEAADVGKALRDMTAERDHLKSREQSIIAACERVADGGQYRADIVSAIQTIRKQRDGLVTAAKELESAMTRYGLKKGFASLPYDGTGFCDARAALAAAVSEVGK